MIQSSSSPEPFVLSLDARTEQLRSIVEPVIVDEGCELVWLTLVPGAQRATLRLFVDTGDSETHIDLAALERLNRLLGDVLDVEDQHIGLFRGQYNLEVSSPGLDRPLAKRSHFEQALGQRVKIRTRVKLETGGRGLTSALLAVDDQGVGLARDGNPESPVRVAWQDLEDAHIVFVFENQASPRPKRTKKRGTLAARNPRPEGGA